MPRVGLNTAEVVRAGAELADAEGISAVSFAAVAERLGVKPPALYKHLEGINDLQHRIATLAMTELGDRLREQLQGRSGADAIDVLFRTAQSYVAAHPGRYSATTGARFAGADDPLLHAAARLIDSIRAALTGYGIPDDQLDDAIRTIRCTIHGYAVLAAADAFQWSNDPRESLAWMSRFTDAGLTALGNPPSKR